MIDDHPELQRRYRSPRAFGPSPGPRNIPASQRDVADLPDEVTTALTVSLEADPVELARLLPPGLHLSGAAVLTVTVARFENLLWLAGRGYPILTVTIPVEYRGAAGDSADRTDRTDSGGSADSADSAGSAGRADNFDNAVRGRFLAVLWEGLADPITTGREELGFPKLSADIRAVRVQDASTGSVDASASWDGFTFVDVTAQGLQEAPAGEFIPPTPTIVHRWVPSIVDPSRADVDQLVCHPVAAPQRLTVTDRLSGTGRFRFHPALFADSPVQYPVVNTLAALTLSPSGPATLIRTTAAPGGTPAASGPRILGERLGRRSGLVTAGALS